MEISLAVVCMTCGGGLRLVTPPSTVLLNLQLTHACGGLVVNGSHRPWGRIDELVGMKGKGWIGGGLVNGSHRPWGRIDELVGMKGKGWIDR
jgi:hypothetical protein